MLDEYVAVDLEMTGLHPKTDRILEVGAVKIKNHVCVAQYQSFVNPHRKLTDRIIELTGIRDEMVADAPEDSVVLQELIDFTGELPLVGHNIMFDYSFLKQCAANAGISYEKSVVDTLKIARKCCSDLPSRKLEDLCRHFRISETQEHRALADAKMTALLLERFWQELGGAQPELFVPKQLQYKAKKQVPATPAQKRDLIELISYHKISFDTDVESLTKSEASRMIDKIYAAYGRGHVKKERI